MTQPKKIRSREELYRRVLSTDPQDVADREAMPLVAQIYASMLVAVELQLVATLAGRPGRELEITRVRRAIGGGHG
ncbi:hypothetical protein [Actinoalloteichus sp. GBA129-24]|uniref:hypothetical protein n=1 Tax=Actinoalloteichus sp. GBA129-24 TaxID=1612551 RepID=UPI000950B277|nr:hypothetical protein [Actinoalloteichus sp. GBA129-24]APU20918.1 hypothetical protein UA75_14540 [Actinoalloteichus sp. GBA129-24]APU24167.1 hypothetical protein UA75_31020 [Actinoalloteichus sp. GBA129-24]